MSDLPPVSVSEARAGRTHNPTDWTPRDALVSLLRQIDAGLAVDALVVSYLYTEGKNHSVGYVQATPKRPHDAYVTIGLLTKVNEMLCREESGA